jgi:hypothetical protein
MRHRPVRAVILAATLAIAAVTVGAASVLAGGWADVQADAAATVEPPVEGQPTVLGFTVLQHGVTPAGWVSATVRLTNLSSGETVEVKAPAGDATGHFLVEVTLPRAGLWSWTVDFTDLAHDGNVFPLTVRNADGTLPTIDPSVALTAIEQTRRDITGQFNDSLYTEIGRIDSALELGASYDERHTTQLTELTRERDALAARVEALEATGSPMTLAVTILLAILAGATAGFVMAWLAGRSGPREIEVSPTAATSPQGSPTA